jgi:hypothetical protein
MRYKSRAIIMLQSTLFLLFFSRTLLDSTVQLNSPQQPSRLFAACSISNEQFAVESWRGLETTALALVRLDDFQPANCELRPEIIIIYKSLCNFSGPPSR